MTYCPTKRLFLLPFALFGWLAICQAQEVYFEQDTRDVERVYHKKTVVPIMVRFQRKFYSGNRASLTLAVTSLGSDVRVIDEDQSFPLDCGVRKSPCALVKVFHLVIPASSGKTDPYIGSQVALRLTGSVNGASFTPVTQVLNIEESATATYKLSDYLADDALRIKTVENVTAKNNVLTIYGTGPTGDHVSRSVMIDSDTYYSVPTASFALQPNHWSPVPISISTLPLQVRPGIDVDGDHYRSQARTGLTIPGVNLSLAQKQWNRYFPSGKKSEHRVSFGLWVNPTVTELDSTLTRGRVAAGTSVNQLFIGVAPSFSYSYNDFSFVLLPYGLDYATTGTGEEYVFERERWWGIGIAIKPSILAPLFNK